MIATLDGGEQYGRDNILVWDPQMQVSFCVTYKKKQVALPPFIVKDITIKAKAQNPIQGSNFV